jgi:hypothetical protein
MHRELNHVRKIKSRNGFEQTLGNKILKRNYTMSLTFLLVVAFFFKYIFVLFVKKKRRKKSLLDNCIL